MNANAMKSVRKCRLAEPVLFRICGFKHWNCENFMLLWVLWVGKKENRDGAFLEMEAANR